VVVLVVATAGREASVPLVSFSIITPLRSSERRVVVVTSTSCIAGATRVDSVVELDEDVCANPTPDIKVRAVIAAAKVFNIALSPRNLG
jgi:hypothetical protein